MHLMAVRCYAEILEHTKVRLKTLMESYAELNELYVNHDGIIGSNKLLCHNMLSHNISN